ncbi:hypothetical protein AB0E69_09970 [Kribbella sp. NPDC026611]|uniref:hypothetical protein n=1 Tax=Kribbella sp. NPDC026611 TaxID=3154911 RepID=UPI00340F67DC
MITKLPANRPLPHKQDILERVLSDDPSSTANAPTRHAGHRRRTWLVPVGAAASIALVAGGVLVATNHNRSQAPAAGHSPSTGTSAHTSTSAPSKSRPAGDVHIDLGPLSAAEKKDAAAKCLAELGISSRATQLTHAVRVRNWVPGKEAITIAFTTEPEGLRYACEGTLKGLSASVVGGDPVEARKSKIALNPPDATHPAAPTEGNSGYYFIEFDKTPDLLVRELWYRVDDRVASVRQRWIVGGHTGPWYVGDAVDGLVYLRSWDKSTALKPGDQVRLETQVLDHAGNLLDAPGDQKGGGGLTPTPGTTRVDTAKVTPDNFRPHAGTLDIWR